ncbi:hypothetical protein AMTRI_Chr10g226720 [Amborella trichopoda]|uniref:SBP-type domain-containing protein n=1 Tax=Amborella trichopoda TaxID=13333 RepID=U5DBQ6_AMBTC|nr:squamosa promoter-binding-like protein 13A [Amborella trichopoda]XP_020530441.1 squamosa promoter-binding-like protein 13A [Amborella trichopoda]XP_020530442.1 squamosa promoter-binding-like protein 13A [Amborella trichopoda]ERN17843.1 hypothetical protein AMTR_s00047p00197010 [Amborella trichopoda]|eukprot:XP_006856376.1 squamosa promoter-binding-like protein 13A [Amborella trichopoda]
MEWDRKTAPFDSGDPMVFLGKAHEENPLLISGFNGGKGGLSSSVTIDLKLGRLGDCESGFDERLTKKTVVQGKRGRGGVSGVPLCQVEGCNVDLRASKDYHKRHKVCDIHSKTAKVIVKGIEQRFCQQCSRFHLLAEFDDGKRSCRKRLAGHNERRRKPQLEARLGKSGRLLPAYPGDRFHGSSLITRTSFICPEIFPHAIDVGLPEPKCGNGNWFKPIKTEEDSIYNPEAHKPITNNQSILKPPFSLYNFGNYKNNPCLQDITSFDAPPTIEGLSRVVDSGCALSLLSSQSWSPSTDSSGIPIAQPLINLGGQAPSQFNVSQFSDIGHFTDKMISINSQTSTSVGSSRFSSSGMNSMEDEHLGAVLVSDSSDATDFKVKTEIMFHEQQRQVKQGNELFHWYPVT